MASHKQTYYHQDEGFDYEKFFYSVFSFTDPFVDGDGLRFTTMFIYQDEQGRPFARYRVSDQLKKDTHFKDEAFFLETFPIKLWPGNYNKEANGDKSRHENFTIFEIYNKFNNLNPDLENKGPLVKQPLDGYFGDKGKNIPEPEDIDFTSFQDFYIDSENYQKNLETFIKVEAIYVKHLLKDFKSKGSFFFPLPIIAFGNVVGVIYFVYNETELRTSSLRGRNDFKDLIRPLILQATREYERVILEGKIKKYYLKPQDPLEDYREVFEDVKQPYININGKKESGKKINYKFVYGVNQRKLDRVITDNPFLLNLGYDDYYEHLAQVITKESNQLQDGKNERIKTAITAIIVDSFAHNIGAHSLVALKWWFEVRYRIAAKQFPIDNPLNLEFDPKKIHKKIEKKLKKTIDFHSFMDDYEHKVQQKQIALLNIIRFMDKEVINQLWKYKYKDKIVAQFPVPVAQSVYHMFQYLRDKSAFWSGVTRDTLFSGQISKWGEVFRTFLNNTLFLGTVAHSEGIKKIYFHVEILDKNGEILVGGEFAQINLEVMELEKRLEEEGFKPKYSNDKQGYSQYAFLRMGRDFEEINKKLQDMESVFLPNGVIGQHALYTLMENTLRNIKHYKKRLKKLSKKGVRLFISIQEVQFLKRLDDDQDLYIKDYKSLPKYNWTENYPMYKVGAWLQHKQKLYNEVGAFVNEEETPFYSANGSVIGAHMQQLRKRVVNENGQPILGGSSQDKVCATMLMNNSFISIDLMNLDEVKRQYFPYIYSASEYYVNWKKREKGFKADDVILHKAYNKKLIGENSDIRRSNYKKFIKGYIKEIVEKDDFGTIKKFFHVWKGEKCKLVNESFNPRHENLARFKVVAVKNYKIDGEDVDFRRIGELEDRLNTAEYDLRKLGIIRLVEALHEWESLSRDELYAEAMIHWLKDWFGDRYERNGIIIFKEEDGRAYPIWTIYLVKKDNEWTIECQIGEEVAIGERNIYTTLGIEHDGKKKGIPVKLLIETQTPGIQTLLIEHGKNVKSSSVVCKLRSHTSFLQEIFKRDPQKDTLKKEVDIDNFMKIRLDRERDSSFKLLETVLTHISIFDARIYERLKEKFDNKKNRILDPFRDQLRIQAYPEKPGFFKDDDKMRTLLSKQHHFIIIHLSFLEAIYRRDEKDKEIPYKETEVQEFFENEIKGVYKELFNVNEIPPNIILVITSGRGRGDWFTATQNPQITFRPIEALVGAIEDGISLKDDFQVKYNLCNVLFGS